MENLENQNNEKETNIIVPSDPLARANTMLAEAMQEEAKAIFAMAKSKVRFEPPKVWVSITRKYSAASAPGVIPQYESLELAGGVARSVGDMDMGANDPNETPDEAFEQMFEAARQQLNNAAARIGIKKWT